MEFLFKDQGLFLALYRIVIGLLFACHGAATLFEVLGGPQGQVPAFGQWPGWPWWAVHVILVGGTLVLLGLAARACRHHAPAPWRTPTSSSTSRRRCSRSRTAARKPRCSAGASSLSPSSAPAAGPCRPAFRPRGWSSEERR